MWDIENAKKRCEEHVKQIVNEKPKRVIIVPTVRIKKNGEPELLRYPMDHAYPLKEE